MKPRCLFALTEPASHGPGDWISNSGVRDALPLNLRHGGLHHGSPLRVACLGTVAFAGEGSSVRELLNDGDLFDGGVWVTRIGEQSERLPWRGQSSGQSAQVDELPKST